MEGNKKEGSVYMPTGIVRKKSAELVPKVHYNTVSA
jgi:hypothetical protein